MYKYLYNFIYVLDSKFFFASFFLYSSDGHPCNQSIHWKMLTGMKNGSQVLVCPESTSEGAKFFIQVSKTLCII